MKYHTEIRPRTGAERTYILVLHAQDVDGKWHSAACSWAVSDIAAIAFPENLPSMRTRMGANAERALWKHVRRDLPFAYEEAVASGWIKSPNDCRQCHGAGWRIEEAVDKLRLGLRWGCHSILDDGPGLLVPKVLAKVECALCNGKGWS